MEVSGQLHAPSHFTPRERTPGTHWIRGWVGPGACLDAEVLTHPFSNLSLSGEEMVLLTFDRSVLLAIHTLQEHSALIGQ